MHDFKMEMVAGIDVSLNEFCPNVSVFLCTVRLRSLLGRVLLKEDGAPRGRVDLNPHESLLLLLLILTVANV